MFRQVTVEQLGDSAAGGARIVPAEGSKPGHVAPQRASNFSVEFIYNMRRILMLKAPTEAQIEFTFIFL